MLLHCFTVCMQPYCEICINVYMLLFYIQIKLFTTFLNCVYSLMVNYLLICLHAIALHTYKNNSLDYYMVCMWPYGELCINMSK